MTLSGHCRPKLRSYWKKVLIPLLVDDPLWAIEGVFFIVSRIVVLIPLLVDDPLWAAPDEIQCDMYFVLIPLLVDDPLWALPIDFI